MSISSHKKAFTKIQLSIFLSFIIFLHKSALGVTCTQIFARHNIKSSRELDKIHSRLPQKIAKNFVFEMLKMPSVGDAKKNDFGLTDSFLYSLSDNSLLGDAEPVIPLSGPLSSKFVKVYRTVFFPDPIEEFDISHNYKNGNSSYDWQGDFVTHRFDWTWVYANGHGDDLLAEYLIPAKLLEIDYTTRKQEPYYVISKEKMENLGIKNVGIFLNRIAQVDSFKRIDPDYSMWSSNNDHRFDDNGPRYIEDRPISLDDKRIRWINEKTLDSLIQKGY